MKNKIEYNPPKRHQPVFSFVEKILKLIYKKPKVYSLCGEVEDKSIILANHCSKKGPVYYDLYFPKYNVKWGAHQMLGNYKSRFKYLRDVYYIRKKGLNKFIATPLAGFEALLSKYFYRGIKVIGTYEDLRFRNTIKKSVEVIEDNTPIVIFPENSNKGYFEVLTEFFGGFAFLAENYYKKHGVDLPIYPVYFHSKKRVMMIGKPYYLQQLYSQGMNRQEVCEFFKEKVNHLYDVIENDKYKKISAN